MALVAFPLNLTDYAYNAQDVMHMLSGKRSGVFSFTDDNLKVTLSSGMNISVAPGYGWLAYGAVYALSFWTNDATVLSVATGDAEYDRIDRVVISWNTSSQSTLPVMTIRQGTPAASPIAPVISQDANTIEIALADIYVSRGATALSVSNITDQRSNEEVCGLAIDNSSVINAVKLMLAFGNGSTVSGRGFAGGVGASASDGGAIGNGASATTGFAGGNNAIASASGAVQLGAGTNDTENTLKFRNTEIVDSEGKIVAANMLRYRTLIMDQYGTYYIPRQEIGEIVHIFVQFPLAEKTNVVTVKTATTPDCEYICIKQERESATLSILKDQAQVLSIESSTTKRTSAHAIVIRCL